MLRPAAGAMCLQTHAALARIDPKSPSIGAPPMQNRGDLGVSLAIEGGGL
jgi:hypothetical protein